MQVSFRYISFHFEFISRNKCFILFYTHNVVLTAVIDIRYLYLPVPICMKLQMIMIIGGLANGAMP